MTAHTLDPSTGTERSGYRQELQRSLSFRDLVTYGLIFMVPIAPFGIFGSVFQASHGMIAAAYVLGMVAMMVTASSYGVNVRAYPVAGSVHAYASRALAPWVGFLAGWTILLDYILVPGLLSLVAALSMTAVMPSVPVWVWIFVFVAVNAGINLAGIKTTRRVNMIALIGALTVLAIFVVTAVAALASGAGRGLSWAPVFSSTGFQWGSVLAGLAVGMLSYLGFDAMSGLAEETTGGPRQISRGMITALAIIGVLFIIQSFLAALLVPSPATLIADGDPAGTAFYDAAQVAAGPWLAKLCAVATALAWGVANNMVAQVATSRLLYAMARDGQLPAFLARVSVSRSVPYNGIWLTAGVSLGLGWYMASRDDGLTVMTSLVNFGALLSFIVVHLCVLARNLRKDQPKVAGWFRSWLLPVVGIVILVAVIVNANALAQKAGYVWLGLGVLILAGLVVTGRPPRLSGIDTGTTDAVPAGHRG